MGMGRQPKLNHSTDKVRESRYDQFNEGLATGVNNRSEPLEDWHSDCSLVDELDAQQIKESIEDGWQCSHWPALIRYNGDRPPSLDRKDHTKIDGRIIVKDVPAPVQESPNDMYYSRVSNSNKYYSIASSRHCITLSLRTALSRSGTALLKYHRDQLSSLDRKSRQKVDGRSVLVDTPAPFPENPYDNYHPANLDSLKCCSTAAFRYYIGRHIKKAIMDEVDVKIVATRVHKILAIPRGEALTTADDLATYNEREDRYQREFAEHVEAASVAKSAKVKDSKTDLAKIGSKFAKLSVLCTHIGFSGLDNMSTAAIRAQRREVLPLLTARMKTAGALNPEDIDRPLDSDEEVLRQFLWGSPRIKYLLWEIQRVILGNTKVASHRKIFATFQFPRSAEMFLKLVEFLGIRANIRAFNEEDMPQILITTYALNIADHDAQHRCATVVHVEPAFNWATEHQAASRVYRFGQEEEVEIVRLFTEGTYQELHEAGMIKKANSMFAAFGELQSASEGLEDREKMTTEEIAKGVFGIVRDRVRGRDDKDVQSAKEDAITKAKGKGKGRSVE
ncbi:uncharacterized protein J4E84_009097 [Alternaria hordeiaustralica]|uniref:uncharacterized protein n=1 Tax=Alternaria hordeiaustralica TaxID=1187925 RepID=UPI0020C346E1|nr:uncharacterized protein J4E84_009097 [Alternaria hordeiaustralica]KAI4677412.1 hypothetical protein J4E84_009097 [Alternaria hordeiaustralica]